MTIKLIILIWLLVWLENCLPHKRKIKTIQKLHKTGEAIIVDNMIPKYENEHQIFLEEIKDGNCKNYSIINKHCDFEDNPKNKKYLKHKRVEIIKTIHRTTGQPIANDEYLLKYELEHQELLKREGGKHIEWPYAMVHPNLDSYCYQYMAECVPRRKRERIIGRWEIEELHYQKINIHKDIMVTTVVCRLNDASKLHYRLTRAPKKNCVYALLRQHHNQQSPLVIVFKYCDFEKPTDYQTISQDYDNLDTDMKLKSEVQVEALQLLPED